ncbi:MAG: hypothetical protein K0R66_767 [Gammaproteobacteria bacterium]|nr:hypothetical protein [Gammaproteobacteria bacterium]
MKLKPIVASLCLIGMATAGTALAASNNTASASAQLKSLQSQLNQLQMKVNNINNAPARMTGVSNVLSLNANLSQQMLSNQSGVGREMNLLKARQMGSLPNQSLTLGGTVQADAIAQHTDSTGYFSNPQANNTFNRAVDNNFLNVPNQSYSGLALSAAKLDSAVALNTWATGYIQLGAYNIGQSTIGSTNASIQDAYLVFGNLAQNPVYGFAGRKEIDFGSFANVQPYAQPLTRIYFMPTGNTAGIGYNQSGLNVTASVMNGGNTTANIENVGSIVQYQNLYTANGNGINNWAFNSSYTATTQGINWTAGAGYLAGSQPQATGTPARTGGAWDLNGKASVSNFDLLAEYVSTVHSAPAELTTFGDTAFPAGLLKAWSVGGDYNFPVMGYKSIAALSYSRAGQGSSSYTAFQYVASYRVQPISNVWTGLEYTYSRGLLGGSLNNTTPDTIATQSNAINDTLVLDVTAYF